MALVYICFAGLFGGCVRPMGVMLSGNSKLTKLHPMPFKALLGNDDLDISQVIPGHDIYMNETI